MGKLRGFQIGNDAVWLPDIAADLVFKVDPASNEVTMSVPVAMDRGAGTIGVGLGSLWVVADGADPNLLLRMDDKTGAEQAKIHLPGAGAGVIAAFGSVWVTAPRSNELYRIDPSSNAVVQTIAVQPKPRFLTSDEHSIWVLEQSGYLQGIDGQSGAVKATIETGLAEDGGDIDAGGGYIWITTRSVPLMQVDINARNVVATYHARDIGDAVRYGAGSVWISGPYVYRVALP